MRTLFAVTRVRGPAYDASKPLDAQVQWHEHAVFMNRLAAKGFIVLGGPIGESGDVLLIIDAATEEEIKSTFAGDPWTVSGMLEISNIQRWNILLEAGQDE